MTTITIDQDEFDRNLDRNIAMTIAESRSYTLLTCINIMSSVMNDGGTLEDARAIIRELYDRMKASDAREGIPSAETGPRLHPVV